MSALSSRLPAALRYMLLPLERLVIESLIASIAFDTEKMLLAPNTDTKSPAPTERSESDQAAKEFAP